MSESPDPSAPPPNPSTTKGLLYARWTGRILGLVLLVWGTLSLTGENLQLFDTVKAVYFVIFGAVINLPFQRLPKAPWKWAFILLSILSAGFTFLMVVSVMFDYMELAEQGQKLGVPGLEGTLLFLALMQPPVVLFRRKPDLFD